ncbi:Sodium/hydrogen exchanger 2 [Frankliniella fusca]|uniref:Sodium/hydrogen exchanger 2 n=1 Tax=Frankliniella fusca TaxID=407009 RepID=A0AAE1HRV3_9NEOP|nr:Sodium/hydrogen exchanger 2 [Frankliniella fusca]
MARCYKKGLEKVHSLECINDVAERGVAIVKRFNKESITKSEENFKELLVAQNDILREEKHRSSSLTLAHFDVNNN